MRNKKSAPFGLAGLGGAERSGIENKHILSFAGAQPRSTTCCGSCIQCGLFCPQSAFAGVCLFTGERRSFLFAMLHCSCGGFVPRYAEEVLA